MKKSTMIRSLILCGLSMLLCISMLAGTTFAWFTDEVQSGKNTIMAGNLDIEVDYLVNGDWESVQDKSDIFDPEALWEPGHVEVAYFRVKNAGTLALKYSLLMNVINYGDGINVYGKEFRLADYINIAIIENVNGTSAAYATRDAAVEAAVADAIAANRTAPRTLGDHTAERVTNDELLSGEEEFFALVVWMPKDVDNVANYKKGTPAPVVEFGVHVMATQTPYENDSFDDQYDAGRDLSDWGTGTATKVPGSSHVYVEANDGAGYKMGYALVPETAMSGNEIEMRMKKLVPDERIPLSANETALTVDVSIGGIAEGNTNDIKVGLEMPKNLDSTYIKLYHEDQEINYISYDAIAGYIEFMTKGFSPFTIVYDASKTAPNPDGIDSGFKAIVEPQNQYENVTIEWGNYGGFTPSADDQKLESAYKFTAPHNDDTIDGCPYKAWACDYVVKINKDIPAGAIFLGGNYGDFGWIGFENPMDVTANEEIYLLGSVLEGSSWTYEGIATWVGEFICGVSKANGTDADLTGATFTVMLRVTNPATNEYYNVNTVTYTFGSGVSIIDGVTETNN